MKIAFFDFDGTITNKDSLFEFIKFAVGNFNFKRGLIALSPVLVLYQLKIVPNYKAKQKMLSYYFRGFSKNEFKNLADKYSLNHIDAIVRPKAKAKLAWHKEQGHKIVVVSASIDCWLSAWCKKNSFELIATQLEIKEDVITGNFLTKNCFGQEKVNRIKEKYNLQNYELIYAYGDSKGDREMLDLADKKYYKYFS